VLSVKDVAERSRENSNMLQGFGDAVLRAEALEDQLLTSRKHAAAMQSKLDAAFSKYHKFTMMSKSCRQRAMTWCERTRASATRTKVRRLTCWVVVGGQEVV
jgi:hypothetical protein